MLNSFYYDFILKYANVKSYKSQLPENYKNKFTNQIKRKP